MMNPRKHKGYNWIVMIEGNTRYVWVWSLKTKFSGDERDFPSSAISPSFQLPVVLSAVNVMIMLISLMKSKLFQQQRAMELLMVLYTCK